MQSAIQVNPAQTLDFLLNVAVVRPVRGSSAQRVYDPENLGALIDVETEGFVAGVCGPH